MSPSATPSEVTALRVAGFEEEPLAAVDKTRQHMGLDLRPEGEGTRLVTRVHAVYDWRHPAMAAFGVVLMELGAFPDDAADAAWHQSPGRAAAPRGLRSFASNC